MTSTPQIYPDYCHTLSPTIGRWCRLRAIDVFALKDVGMYCDGIRIFHHKNHPIKWVRLTGVVVAVDTFGGRRVYTLDDSSGMTIECVAALPKHIMESATIEMDLVPRHLDQLAQMQVEIVEKERERKERVMVLAGYAKMKEKNEEKVEASVATPVVAWEYVDVGCVVKIKGRVGAFRDVKQVEVVKIEILKGTDLEIKCWDEGLVFRRDVLGTEWVVSEEEAERCRRKRERDLKRERRAKEKDRRGGSGQGRKSHGHSRERTRPQLNATRPSEKIKSEKGKEGRSKNLEHKKATRPPEITVPQEREHDARDEVLRVKRQMPRKEPFEKNSRQDSSVGLRKAAAAGAAKT